MSDEAIRRILQRAFDEYYDGTQKVLAGLSPDAAHRNSPGLLIEVPHPVAVGL